MNFTNPLNILPKANDIGHGIADMGHNIQKDMTSMAAKIKTNLDPRASKEATVAFDPLLSAIPATEMTKWMESPITGDLSEVPGMGFDSNQDRLSTGKDCVTTTHQLLGHYLTLRAMGMDNMTNAEMFNEFLHTRGITSHRNSIVHACAEKVNMMIPGSFDMKDYGDK